MHTHNHTLRLTATNMNTRTGENCAREMSRKALMRLCREAVVNTAEARASNSSSPVRPSTPRRNLLSSNGGDSITTPSSSSVLARDSSELSMSSTATHREMLRLLQQERVVLSRLGFPEKIKEIDINIEKLQIKIQRKREREEKRLIEERLAVLHSEQEHKRISLERVLKEEKIEFVAQCRAEEKNLLEKQERDFLGLLESASRRASGNVQKCDCKLRYLCKHNRSTSGNLRRPSREVTAYRKSAEVLARAGRWDEAVQWECKADELDAAHEKEWRAAVAKTVITSSWGSHASSALEKLEATHKRELKDLQEQHRMRRILIQEHHKTRRRRFETLVSAEEKKIRKEYRKSLERKAHVNDGLDLPSDHLREIFGAVSERPGTPSIPKVPVEPTSPARKLTPIQFLKCKVCLGY